MKQSGWISSVSALAAALAATPALAQSAPAEPASPPEAEAASSTGQAADADTETAAEAGNAIVVTAQRREQSLQDVPLAVSAFSSETLERQQINTTQGLLRAFPNVSGAQVSGSGAANYSIRGLSNAETASTFDSPVGTYIDGIYLARINANNFALFDVERIEVLRGPQGTLFGRNTTGGAINIILKQPSSSFGGKVEGSYGSFDHKMLRASIDAPLSDSIRTRLSGYWMEEDGWVKNITTGGHENGHDGWGIRGAASIDVSPDVTWDVSVDHVHDVNAEIPASKINGDWVSKSGLGKLGNLFTNGKGDIAGNRVFNDTTGLTSKIRIDSAIGAVSIITGYRHLLTEFNLDYFDNPSPFGGYDSVQISKHNQFSQEANVSGSAFGGLVDYTFGLFYFHEYNKSDFGALFNTGALQLVLYDRTFYNTTDSFAGYGQLDWHLGSKVILTTGGRWTGDTKHLHYVDNDNPLVSASAKVTDAMLLTAGIPLRQETSVFTPRVALTYQPNSDLTFYASATNGFKSGGWNVRAATVNSLGAFGDEKIWSFEGGMRSQWFDRKLTFNLTGFYGYTDGLQIATASGAGDGGPPVFPVGNFSDFVSYGLEAEATINPTRGLSIFANVGYNSTKYTNPTDAVKNQQERCLASIAAGTPNSNCGNGIIMLDGGIAYPLRAPKFTGTAGFSYEIPLIGDWNLVPAGSVRHVSSFNVNSAELPTTFDDGYTLVAASIGIENPDSGLRFTVGCENCTNQHYLVSVISGYTWWSPSARWTATAAVEF